MIVVFRASFAKDLKRVNDQSLLNRLKEVVESVENAKALSDLPNLKKLKSDQNYYRLRMGDYRVGMIVESNVVVFVRFLHRKEIYRYFP